MNRPTPKRGFTLIEIMLALLVITVGVVAVIGLLSTTLDSSAKSHDDLNVVSFADMVFNHCHSTNWNSISSSGTLSIPDYDEGTVSLHLGTIDSFTSYSLGTATISKEQYTLSYQLDVITSTQYPNTKELTLQIWTGFNASTRPRIFYTEIYSWAKNP